MGQLSQRELFAIASTDDGLSAEQKAAPDWQVKRDAISEALARLDIDPALVPQGIEGDPVAAWLETRASDEQSDQDTSASLAENLCTILDKHYEEGRAAGRTPTFDATNPRRHFFDLADYDSETVSALALNRESLFSSEEVRAANSEVRRRASNALMEGYSAASKSGDPTVFARNIIELYSSLSPDVRQAAGFGEAMLRTAVFSYETTAQLMNMMQSNMDAGGGIASGFSSRQALMESIYPLLPKAL